MEDFSRDWASVRYNEIPDDEEVPGDEEGRELQRYVFVAVSVAIVLTILWTPVWVRLVLGAMRMCPRVATVQRNGCQALAELSEGTAGVPTLVELSAHRTVLNAMTNHPADSRVQVWGCVLMHNLAETSNSALVAIGVGEAVLRAMRGHLAVVEVQVCGCAALTQLGRDNQGDRAVLVKHGARDVVIQAMREHPADPNVQREGRMALAGLAAKV